MGHPGNPWPIPIKQGQGKILWDDGNLQRSLSVKVDGQTVIQGLHATTEGFPYPATHQFVTDKAGRDNRTTIPARQFLPITEDDELLEEVKEATLEGLEEGVLGE